MKKLFNGQQVDMSPEEEAAWVAEQAAWEAGAIDRAKAAKIAALDKERLRLENLPISGNDGGKLFTISRPEKIQEFLMGGLSIALDSSPAATFTMLDDNGVEVTYNKALMGAIIRFINTSKGPSLARYNDRKAAVAAATTVAEVDAVSTDLTKA